MITLNRDDCRQHAGATTTEVSLPLRLLHSLPMLRRIPERIVGIGVRPERVETESA